MRVVVQKCREAKVMVEGECVGSSAMGLLLLVGFTEGDHLDTIQWMVQKILHLRIFDDEQGIMNHSVLDVKGSILSVSQFTLYGDCTRGNRPSYTKALPGQEANLLYEQFNQELAKYITVETGKFGCQMEVSFINVGPTTILLER